MVTPPLRTGRGGMLAALLLAALCAQAAGQSTPSLPKSLSDCLKKAAVRVVAPTDKSYAYNSEVGNKLVSYSKPKGVAFPTSGSQVAAAVKCAAAANVRATPRCGGHGYEGYAVLNNTLTIDVSGLDKTTLSADQTTATVGGGSTLGKAYYYVWQQSGGKRAMVGGTCPAVGAGGHIPGGGLGYLTRQYGLACDQVVQVKVVDAKGSTHTATKAKNSDLFWASCGGGGGNFGIITEFKVKTVPLPPNVTVVELGIPSANAVPFLQFWQKWAGSVDSKFTTVVNPGSPVSFSGVYLGSKAEATKLMKSSGILTKFAPTRVSYKEMSYINSVILHAYDPTVKKPADLLKANFHADRGYWKLKSYVAMGELPQKAMELMQSWVLTTNGKVKPSGTPKWTVPVKSKGLFTYIELDAIGPKSAVAKVGAAATAFPYRKALFTIQFGAQWNSPTSTASVLKSVNELQKELRKYISGGVAYINYIDADVPNPMDAYYGSNLGRLERVKAKWDPQNYWRNPRSIPPAKKSG